MAICFKEKLELREVNWTNWINLKLRELNWTKVNYNEFQSNLESTICILAKILLEKKEKKEKEKESRTSKIVISQSNNKMS